MRRAAAAAALALLALPAAALRPDLHLDQFHHSAWTARDGIPGPVESIAQDADGLLWLGTGAGLFRFDGVAFEPVRTLGGQAIGTPFVRDLRSEPRGGMLLSYRRTGAAELAGGRYLAHGAEAGFGSAERLLHDLDARLWAIGDGYLCRFDGARCVRVGAEAGYPANPTFDVMLDSRGTLWAVSQAGDQSLWCLRRGETSFRRVLTQVHPQAVLADAEGDVWVSGGDGLDVLPAAGDAVGPARHVLDGDFGVMLDDRDGTLWLAARDGLLRLRNARGAAAGAVPDVDDRLTRGAGLGAAEVRALFEDREGDLWIGTANGVERLRDSRVVRARLAPGRELGYSLAATPDGVVWAGSWDGPLQRIAGERVTEVRDKLPPHLGALWVDPRGALWAGGPDGLWRSTDGRRFSGVPGADAQIADNLGALTVDGAGTLWIDGGVAGRPARLERDRWRRLDDVPGMPATGGFSAALTDDHGRAWLAVGDRIVVADGPRTRWLDRAGAGLDVGQVLTLHRRGARLWAGGTAGVAAFDGERFHALRDESGAAFGQVTGIVETVGGDLWLNQISETLHIAHDELERGAPAFEQPLHAERFDALDGREGTTTLSNPRPSLVESADGRLWLSTNTEVASIDPARAAPAPRPPTVLLRAVIADGVAHAAGVAVSLAAGTARVEFQYTATALAYPERVRFRYRLEGFDADWQDAGARRQAFYNSLPPGKYRFRVDAAESGRWSGAAAGMSIEVAPAWYQTGWFRAACVAAALLTLALLHRVRVGVVSARIIAQLVTRMRERERIARELHDTLLQSFHGVMMKLRAASERLEGPPLAQIGAALEDADRALVETRDRIQDLRPYSTAERGLAAIVRDLAAELDAGAGFELHVRGRERALDPLVSDEVESILAEGLRNALRHAHARHVRVDLRFTRWRLEAVLADDGIGMDEPTLRLGRARHWGLSGMRERGRRIGADVAIASAPGRGTTLRVTVSGRVAWRGRARPAEAGLR